MRDEDRGGADSSTAGAEATASAEGSAAETLRRVARRSKEIRAWVRQRARLGRLPIDAAYMRGAARRAVRFGNDELVARRVERHARAMVNAQTEGTATRLASLRAALEADLGVVNGERSACRKLLKRLPKFIAGPNSRLEWHWLAIVQAGFLFCAAVTLLIVSAMAAPVVAERLGLLSEENAWLAAGLAVIGSLLLDAPNHVLDQRARAAYLIGKSALGVALLCGWFVLTGHAAAPAGTPTFGAAPPASATPAALALQLALEVVGASTCASALHALVEKHAGPRLISSERRAVERDLSTLDEAEAFIADDLACVGAAQAQDEAAAQVFIGESLTAFRRRVDQLRTEVGDLFADAIPLDDGDRPNDDPAEDGGDDNDTNDPENTHP